MSSAHRHKKGHDMNIDSTEDVLCSVEVRQKVLLYFSTRLIPSLTYIMDDNNINIYPIITLAANDLLQLWSCFTIEITTCNLLPLNQTHVLIMHAIWRLVWHTTAVDVGQPISYHAATALTFRKFEYGHSWRVTAFLSPHSAAPSVTFLMLMYLPITFGKRVTLVLCRSGGSFNKVSV